MSVKPLQYVAADIESTRLRKKINEFTELTPQKEVRETRESLIKTHEKIFKLIKEMVDEGIKYPKLFPTYSKKYAVCVLKCSVLSMSVDEPASTSPRQLTPDPVDKRDTIHLDGEEAEVLKQKLDSLEGTKNIWDITSLAKKTKDSIPFTHNKNLQKHVLPHPNPLPALPPVTSVKEKDASPVSEKVGHKNTDDKTVKPERKLNSFDEKAKDSMEINRKNMKPEPIPKHRPAVPGDKKNNACLVSEKDDKTKEVIETLPPLVPVIEKANAPIVTGNLAPEEKFPTFAYCPPVSPLAFVPATSSSTLRQPPILTEIKVHCKVPAGHVLYIRGSGAGLSWTHGIPLKKTDDGTDDTYVYSVRGARGNLEYKILLDDTQWESGENHRIEQGKAQEFTPDLVIPEVVAPVVEAPKLPKTTQIAVDIDVGFGHKLFIRGEEPLLSWDMGKEMQYKDGKWVIEFNKEFDKPLECKFLIDDKKWEGGDNHKIAYGQPEELTIKF